VPSVGDRRARRHQEAVLVIGTESLDLVLARIVEDAKQQVLK
jgi:hypothetical protein